MKYHLRIGAKTMAANYKKLWKLLIDKDLKKKDLQRLADISNYTVSKLTRGDNVTVDVLEKTSWIARYWPSEQEFCQIQKKNGEIHIEKYLRS